MQPFENMQVLPAIPPTAIKDDAAFVSNAVDIGVAGGAQSLVFAVFLGAIDADLAVFKVAQSDVLTNPTTLGGTPEDIIDITTIVTPGSDDDNKVVLVQVDLSAPRKRYIQLQVTAGNGAAGTFLSAGAFLVNVGVPATDAGALAYVKV